jgi:hypothetical protein
MQPQWAHGPWTISSCALSILTTLHGYDRMLVMVFEVIYVTLIEVVFTCGWLKTVWSQFEASVSQKGTLVLQSWDSWAQSEPVINSLRTNGDFCHKGRDTEFAKKLCHKNDVKGKLSATSRHCFVMSRNSGGLDTVHTMQIASDSGPDKYFEVFYH